MKLPLLIFSLVLIYWSCVIYADKNIDSTGDTINSIEKYTLDYQDAPLKKFLSRYKRSSIISSLMHIPLLGNVVTSLQDNISKIYGILTGEEKCRNVTKLSLRLIARAVLHPFKTIETILCHFLNGIGNQSRALIILGFNAALEITKKILLPELHKILNQMYNTNLPTSIKTLIDIFNILYLFLQIIGFVE